MSWYRLVCASAVRQAEAFKDAVEKNMSDDNWQDRSTHVCELCLWWVWKGVAHLGRCRRHAPKVGEGWPATYATDWCGDHKLVVRDRIPMPQNEPVKP